MNSLLLPDDIIYYKIFPFLVNRICNTSDFQIFRVNKRVLATKPSCFSAPKSKFGNQVWCSVHTPHEYTFSQNIKDQIGSIQPQKNLTEFFNSSDDDDDDDDDFYWLHDDQSLTYHNYDHTYTPNNLLYFWKRVVDNSPYEVEHLCCGGNGVVISRRRNVSPKKEEE